MDMETVKHAGILLAGVFISSISQVLLKKAAGKHYDPPIREYLNPMVIAAYAMFAAASFLSVAAYKGIPLSMGPVLEAAGYIFVTVFGVKIFKEKVDARKIAALGIIIAGIMVYSFLG